MNKPISTTRHFNVLPFINMGDVPEVDLGFAKVWNFDLRKEEYIKDNPTREHIEKILRGYRTSTPCLTLEGLDSYPQKMGIGLITTGAPTSSAVSKHEKQDINDARLMLFISALSQCNTVARNMNSGHSMSSSENYGLVYFSGIVGSEHITERSGFALPTMHGGIEIKYNIFIQPRHIPNPRFAMDENLLNTLLSLRKKQKKKFRRVMSAIEVFYESYYNSPEVSHNARILLQASAFEILLANKQGSGRRTFKNFLEEFGDYPEDRLFRYKFEKHGCKKWETKTKRVMWADRFFTLRNHILHGEVPSKELYNFGKDQRHFDIALLFFVFCIKRKLEEGLGKEIFDDDVVWKTWTDNLTISSVEYTGFQYTNYGRRGRRGG